MLLGCVAPAPKVAHQGKAPSLQRHTRARLCACTRTHNHKCCMHAMHTRTCIGTRMQCTLLTQCASHDRASCAAQPYFRSTPIGARGYPAPRVSLHGASLRCMRTARLYGQSCRRSTSRCANSSSSSCASPTCSAPEHSPDRPTVARSKSCGYI